MMVNNKGVYLPNNDDQCPSNQAQDPRGGANLPAASSPNTCNLNVMSVGMFSHELGRECSGCKASISPRTDDKLIMSVAHSIDETPREEPLPNDSGSRLGDSESSMVPYVDLGALYWGCCKPNCKYDRNTSMYNCEKCRHRKCVECKPVWVED